ncbi:glycosyltransferase family 4 protein [Gordonia sp. NPDC003376]
MSTSRTPPARRRIVFVAHTGMMSGAEAVMLHLTRLALADGHPVAVACPAGPLVEALPPGVRHVELPALGLDGGGRVARVRGLARLGIRWIRAGRTLRTVCRDDSDVVVNSLFALPAVRLSRLPGGCSWLVHDTVVDAKRMAVARLGAPAVRVAVAVSEETAKPLRHLGFRVVVRYNGVPVVSGDRDVADGRPVVGVLAKLTPWKGHRVLLEAMTRLPDVDLEIAGDWFPGDAAYVAELHTIAAAPELAGRVRFLGRAEPGECLRRWTALISPSVAPEAGPLGVLEAMSAGCPVIGTALGGTAEYLADGAGLLVPPEDPAAIAESIATVVADSSLRHQLSERGRKRVRECHDLRRTGPEMLQALTRPSPR